jgi:hypothetical protein
MTLFRIVVVLLIAGVAALVVLDRRRGSSGRGGAWQFLWAQVRTAFQIRSPRKGLGDAGLLDDFRRMTSVLSALLCLLLCLSGFLPVLILGKHLSGTLLIIHVTAAPLFALCLSALALLWAHRLRFGEEDWRFVLNPARRKIAAPEARIRLALKVGFWLLLLFSLPLIGSIILSLFPLFGTEEEAALTTIHGYSSLLFLLAAIVEVHLTIIYVRRTKESSFKEGAE